MSTRFDPVGPLPAGLSLLEASAGTGKTWSITALVARLVVEEGLRLDQVLVVTFTEPATAELRDRVRDRLRRAMSALEKELRAPGGPLPDDPVVAHLVRRARSLDSAGSDVERLRSAIESFDQAAISTIHGFCARVLREHAFECGAEFDAELLADPSELLDEIVHDFWAREVATRPAAMVRELCELGVGPAALGELARHAVRYPDARVEPAVGDAVDWMAADETFRIVRDDLARGWRTHGPKVRSLIEASVDAKELSGVKYQRKRLPGYFAEVEAWAANPVHVMPDERIRKFGASALREGVNKGKQPPSHAFFSECDELLEAIAVAQAARRAAFAEELLVLQHACVRYVREQFARRKRARRLQTYDDMLHLVRDALRDAEHGERLAAALRERWSAALIDEFQDTDGVQWEIFRRVFDAPAHRLVLIGDPKQAIYSFRGADVHAYLDARRAAGAPRTLGTNQRSDAPLVKATNGLFGRVPGVFAVEGVEFEPVDARHVKPRLLGDGSAPLQLRTIPRADGAPHDKGEVRALVPALVADDVVRILQSGTRIVDRKGSAAPVRPGDVTVLVRKNRQALEIQRALRRSGVPAVIHGAVSVFASREAEELEAVLAALLEPSSMRLLRRALATDLLGLAAAAELEEAGVAPRGALGAGDALARLDEDEVRWDAWLDRVRAWSACWTQRGTMPALRWMMDELRLPERLLALEDGERRLTNLRHLAELLHVQSIDGPLEPPALLDWLRQQRDEPSGDREAHQVRLESDADAVQVSTIHRAKGLEFPVVLCPYLWETPLRRERPVFVVHDGTGHVIDVSKHHEGRAANLDRLKAEHYAEELRLAYVALTRAKHRTVVYCPDVKELGQSPLGRLLHGREGANAAECLRATEEYVSGADGETLQRELAAIADALAPEAAVAPCGAPERLRWRGDAAPAATLAARPWQRRSPLDGAWRIGSFTGLTRDAHAVAAVETDEPEAVADARGAHEEAVGVHAESVSLDLFPSSARAGIFFHDVLERHDPAQPATLEPLVAERLGAFGFDTMRWTTPVTSALRGVLDAPLLPSGALRLSDIPRASRLTELRFEFPVHGGLEATDGAVSAGGLARVFREHATEAVPAAYADRVAALRFRELRGFLSGAMDLVARHDGKWWLVDYKSNHLGPRASDYSVAAMRDEMARSHYYLQYHLYLVALHRYLRWRQPGYDYERDFGGVLYLFLRGMDQGSGAGTGIFADRPPLARVSALDHALGAREGGA